MRWQGLWWERCAIFWLDTSKGKLSGSIDESIRHAILKFAHIHLFCNDEAKNRIFVTGSLDIDIMMSEHLPSLKEVRQKYKLEIYRLFRLSMFEKVDNFYAAFFNIVNQIDTDFMNTLQAYNLKEYLKESSFYTLNGKHFRTMRDIILEGEKVQ